MPNKIKKLMIEGSSRLKQQKKKAEPSKVKKAGGENLEAPLEFVAKSQPERSKGVSYESAAEDTVAENRTDKADTAVNDPIKVDDLNDFFRYTKPDEPFEIQDDSSSDDGFDEFIARNITPQMKESLNFVLRSNLSLECLEVMEQLSTKNKNFVPFLKKMDRYGLTKICEITDDDDYVITAKMRIIALLNKISKNEIIHRLLRRTGALIQALRRLKELLFANM